MKKRKTSEHYSTIHRILMLATHQKEMAVLHKMIGSYKCLDAEERFAQFRILVRTFDTCIESLLFIMKSEALKAHDRGYVAFSDNEVEKLRGTKLSKDGSKEVPIKFKFAQNARLAVRLFDAATGGPTSMGRKLIQLPKRVGEWSTLRNRVTHPKTLDDFKIRINDTDVARVVGLWYLELSGWVVNIETMRSESAQEKREKILAKMKAKTVDGAVPTEILDNIKARLLETLK